MFTFVLSVGAAAVQLVYWRLFRNGFDRARARDATVSSNAPQRACLVVAARNEAEALPRLLDAIARQEHPALDVIVVNDGSTDGTGSLARSLLPSATVIDVADPAEPRKKNALLLGIEAATGDILLFTDADCEPPTQWGASLSRRHANGAPRVIVGYSPFIRCPGLLNAFARYETFIAGFAAAAAVGLGAPYTAVGRNFSYRRSLFERAGGFAETVKSLSGDDDLLLQHLASQPDVEVVHAFGSETYVPSDAPTTWRSWMRQKLRHTSAGRYYKSRIKRHLFAYHASALLTWAAPFVCGWSGLGLLIARQAYQTTVLRKAADVLGEQDLMALQPLYEVAYVIYNTVVAPLGVIRRPKAW